MIQRSSGRPRRVAAKIPAGAGHTPVTLIHGCCLTGKTWETTPDGRMGWDEYFVRQGFPTYVIDQVARGRSATDPSTFNSIKLGKTRRLFTDLMKEYVAASRQSSGD